MGPSGAGKSTLNNFVSGYKTGITGGEITITGQAHDMFSRIFRIRIYKFFSTNDYVIFVFDFFKCSKLRKKIAFFDQ